MLTVALDIHNDTETHPFSVPFSYRMMVGGNVRPKVGPSEGVFGTPEQHENSLDAMWLAFSDHNLKGSWTKDLRHPLMTALG